jgi:hypothetical protein
VINLDIRRCVDLVSAPQYRNPLRSFITSYKLENLSQFQLNQKLIGFPSIIVHNDKEIHINDFHFVDRRIKLEDLVVPFRTYLGAKREEKYNYFSWHNLYHIGTNAPKIKENSIILVSLFMTNYGFYTTSGDGCEQHSFTFELTIKDNDLVIGNRIAYVPYAPNLENRTVMVLKKV